MKKCGREANKQSAAEREGAFLIYNVLSSKFFQRSTRKRRKQKERIVYKSAIIIPERNDGRRIYYSCRTFKNVISPAKAILNPHFLLHLAQKAHKNVYRKTNFVFPPFVVISVVKCIQIF